MKVRTNKRIARKIMCGILGFAVALSMCIGLVPQKVLAAGAIYIMNDGTKLAEMKGDEDPLLVIDEINNANSVSYDVSTKTLTMNGMTAKFFSGEITKFVVKGTCSVETIYYPGPISVTLEGADASFTIGKIHSDATGDDFTPSAAADAKMITITGGKLSGDKIVADSADNRGGTDGSGGGGTDGTTNNSGSGTDGTTNNSSGVTDGTTTNSGSSDNAAGTGNTGKVKALKVNDKVQEKGKTAAKSPTYKVTSVNAKNRTVTFVKPANNVSATVTIKDEVVLPDNQKYKVTAIADNAFANCKGKNNIKNIVIGQNVKKIGKKAFYSCAKAKKITVKSPYLTTKSTVGKYAFKNTDKNANVIIKLNKKYKKNATKVVNIFKQKNIGYVKTWKVKNSK